MTGASARPGELLTDQAQFYRGEGHKAQTVGDLDTAEASYRKAIINDPYYAEAYVDLGVILESRGKLADAETAYLAALKVSPKLAAAHTNLGLLYERQGKIKEAGEHWQHRVRIGPENDPWVAKTKEKLKKYNLPVPESAVEMKKKREMEIRRAYEAGKVHLKAKEYEQASAEFRRVLELDPNHKGARKGLEEAMKGWNWEKGQNLTPAQQVKKSIDAASVYMKNGQWDRAEAEYRKALALDPNNKSAMKGLEAVQKARTRRGDKGAEGKDAMIAAMDAALLGQGATGRAEADQARRWADEAGRKADEAKKRMDAARKSAEEAAKMSAARQADMEKIKAEEAKRSSSKAEEESKRQQAIKESDAARKQAEEASMQAEKAKAAAENVKKTAQGPTRDEAIKQAEEAAKKAIEVKQVTESTMREADEIKKMLGIAVTAKPAAPAAQKPAQAPVVREEKPAASAARAANDFEKDKTKTQLQAIRELYQRGVGAMRQGNYQEAVTNFEQVLALEPNHPEAKQGLKRAQIALSKSDK